jgi:Mg/Co/Ni transporter MgtE
MSVQNLRDRDLIANGARRASVEAAPSQLDAIVSEAWSRGKWLLGLLILQSMSSIVLDSYQQLLKEHMVVTLFLTMLIGAGGNAGNQSAIRVRCLDVESVLLSLTRLSAFRWRLHEVAVCCQCPLQRSTVHAGD